MKILLVGEYSNVHWTLAEGLRTLGHEVTVVSDGDHWKGYQRDIDLRRRSLRPFDTLRYLFDLRRLWPRLKGYDVVQLINPVFLDLRAERILPYYERLRRENGRMFLGSFGIDKPWVEEGLKAETFRYSDFYLFGQRRLTAETYAMEADWFRGEKGRLFDFVAQDCDGIVAGLYENYVCCQPKYSEKLHFIPFPIDLSKAPPHSMPHDLRAGDGPISFFIGIQRSRSAYKGTDIMLRALEKLKAKYPDRVCIVKAESVPFEQYCQMMDESQVLLDQLYSYTPAMNALLAMSKGIVVVGGGEEEHYRLLGESELRPIVNVQPTEESVAEEIERQIIMQPGNLDRLSRESVEYVRRHHDYVRVAQRYIEIWQT